MLFYFPHHRSPQHSSLTNSSPFHLKKPLLAGQWTWKSQRPITLTTAAAAALHFFLPPTHPRTLRSVPDHTLFTFSARAQTRFAIPFPPPRDAKNPNFARTMARGSLYAPRIKTCAEVSTTKGGSLSGVTPSLAYTSDSENERFSLKKRKREKPRSLYFQRFLEDRCGGDAFPFRYAIVRARAPVIACVTLYQSVFFLAEE